ncbi:MAG: rRNA methyltransferase [Flavobacteriales bacterium]|nr:MAG: rRNA methyltransferase [Flavobacteriales bacterium]
MPSKNNQELLDHLLGFLSENKKTLFYKIIENRTRYLTVILENIYQSQNASAVLRTCDVFGIQDVHIIENENEYNINPRVVHGASKWVTLHKYNEKENNTLACIKKLKADGYKVYGTTPHTNDCLIQDIPIDNKVALMFGTEMTGLSNIAMEHVDGFVKIPMYGFTESLNLSVSAGISLYEINKRLNDSVIDWHLTEKEKTNQLITWAKKVIKDGERIEKQYLEKLEK